MSYYNTNRESGETLKRSWGQARTQDDYILYIFQEYKDKLFTALPNLQGWLTQNFTQLNRYARMSHGKKS